MKEASFLARTETGEIVTVVVRREEKEIRTRAGAVKVPGLIELTCPELGTHVNADPSDASMTHFETVFPHHDLYRVEDSPYPEI